MWQRNPSEYELETFRRVLESKRTELISNPRDSQAIAVERAADAMDQLILAAERDLAVETLSREAMMLGQIEEALQRIAAGTFGICVLCDEPISAARLAALPWAALCLKCQAAADQEQAPEGDDFSKVLLLRSEA